MRRILYVVLFIIVLNTNVFAMTGLFGDPTRDEQDIIAYYRKEGIPLNRKTMNNLIIFRNSNDLIQFVTIVRQHKEELKQATIKEFTDNDRITIISENSDLYILGLYPIGIIDQRFWYVKLRDNNNTIGFIPVYVLLQLYDNDINLIHPNRSK